MSADPPPPEYPPSDPPAGSSPGWVPPQPPHFPPPPEAPAGAYAWGQPAGPYGFAPPPPYNYATPPDPKAQVQLRNVPAPLWLGILAVLFGGAGVAVACGQIQNYFAAVAQVAPFAVIALFAYLGKKHDAGAYLSFLSIAILLLLGFVVTVLLVATAGVPGSGTGQHQQPTSPAMAGQVQAALVWCLAAWVGALLSAIPVVRERVARWLPIDPDSPVHAAALALISSLVILSLGQLAATGGRPVLLTIIQNHPDQLKDSAVDTVVEMALTMAFVIPGSWIVVGWPLFRSLREALERLGVVVPTSKQVIGALVTAVAMVIVFQGLDWVTNAIWSWTHWPKTDGEAFDHLIKPLITPGGALLIGLSAGVTEELMVRGALQPRLGIIVSNLFFTSLHAFQYGFDGLISVFMAGLVLGLVRKRTNTTCSAITHGTYDFILVLMSWFVAH